MGKRGRIGKRREGEGKRGGGEEGEGGEDRKALHTRLLLSHAECVFPPSLYLGNEVAVKKDISWAGKDGVGRAVLSLSLQEGVG